MHLPSTRVVLSETNRNLLLLLSGVFFLQFARVHFVWWFVFLGEFSEGLAQKAQPCLVS